jgi:phage tail-like protein
MDSFGIDNNVIPSRDTNYKFKKQNAGNTPCGFVFYVYDITSNDSIKLKSVGGFSQVSGLDRSIDTDTFKDGRKRSGEELPGQVKYGNISLANGFSNGFLQVWADKCISSYSYMVHSGILILDSTRRYVVRNVLFKNSWIKNYSVGAINNADSDLLTEQISLSHAGFYYCDMPERLILADLYSGEEKVYLKHNLFSCSKKRTLEFDFSGLSGNIEIEDIVSEFNFTKK